MGVCVCVWVDRCGVEACRCLSVYVCGCVYGWVCVWVCVCVGGDVWVWMCVHMCVYMWVGVDVCARISNVLPFHVNMIEVHVCFHSLKEQRMLASLWGDLCLASVQTPLTAPLFSLYESL